MYKKKNNMRQILFIKILVLLTVLAACDDEPLITEGTISGIVTNSQFNNEPIAGATVTISGTNEEKVTGSDGRFEFVVESNTTGFTLQYSHPEFRTDENSNVRVAPGGETTADMALDPIVPLELSLINLDFGSSSSQESFNITNLRNGELDFTVTTSADFVTASPNTGRIGAQNTTVIRVSIDRANLAVGERTEQIIINVPNRGSAVVNVLITVLDASAAVLTLDQSTLGYGTETTSRNVQVSNTGEKTLEWTAAVSDSWITLSDASGSLNPTANQSITINVNRTDLDAGEYTGTVDFSGNGGNATVNITMEVVPGNAQPVLGVSATEFDFGLETQSFDVSINNTGNAVLDWSASSSDSWLTLSRSSGSVSPTGSQSLTLNVSREGLNEGTFTATVTVSSNGGEATLNASMEVPSQSPVLALSVTSLDFGETNDLQSITIENTGLQDLNWSASTDQDWLSLSSTSGTVAAASSQDINVNIDRSGLADGSYSGQISFTSDGGDATVAIDMTVVGNGAGDDADNDGVPDAVDSDDDGDGLIEIFSINDLYNIRNDLTADGSNLSGAPTGGFTGYELMNDLDFDNSDDYSDIDLKSDVTTGQGWTPIALSTNSNFNTTFEGNGFTISNLLMDRTGDYTALFGSTGILSAIRNVRVTIKFLSGDEYTAGLVGLNRGEIESCSVDGHISATGGNTALLIGRHATNRVTNCFTTGSVDSNGSSIGGLIGSVGNTSSDEWEVAFSYSKASVSGNSRVGGLIGSTYWGSGEITSGYATGEIEATDRGAGGFIGALTYGELNNSYSLGSVTSTSFYVGGFVGENTRAISNSFSVGSVTGSSNLGGFAGRNTGSITSTNYWDTTTSGYETTSGNATGLTTTQLQGQTTADGVFVTWSTDTWDFGTANQYPALKNMPGGLNEQRD